MRKSLKLTIYLHFVSFKLVNFLIFVYNYNSNHEGITLHQGHSQKQLEGSLCIRERVEEQ